MFDPKKKKKKEKEKRNSSHKLTFNSIKLCPTFIA